MSRLLVIALLMLPLIAFALEPEMNAAKDEGLRLYNAHLRSQALPYLEPAAEAGDAESQYWLDILIGDGLGDYPDEAQREEVAEAWLRRAAEQGHVPAMNRFSIIPRPQAA